MSSAEKRQRVNRACDECKRTKKQCTGSQPCALCVARSRPCVFSNVQATRVNNNQPVSIDATQGNTKRKAHSHELSRQDGRAGKKATFRKDPATDDETSIPNNERLLKDRGGRLLYIGDSASLSFLQNIRRLIENAIGASAFTTDSSRHTILEATILTAPSNQIPNMLPQSDTTQYLVNSFFQNTTGLLDIFDKEDFLDRVEKTYDQPLDASPEWLCQLNLVLAIGLQMRRINQNPTAAESRILSRLGAGKAQRAETFFLSAKHLNDSTCGFEEGGIESVQSLLLMAVYMLTASKRNTAWVHLGTAVRLAYALGIHNQQTLLAFSASEQTARISLWQSLQVMDCFLSASLGRPSSITHACASWSCPPTPRPHQSHDLPHPTNSLQQSVIASEIICEVLTRIYHRRKVSRSVAYALTLHFGKWKEALPAELHWQNTPSEVASPELAMKRLHVNLLYFHGITLLTRPFFLHQVSIKIDAQGEELTTGNSNAGGDGEQAQSEAAATRCFHGACVRSAVQTLSTVHSALVAHELPTRNPFIIYWVFSASLIVMTNAFCPVFLEPETETLIFKALNILKWCGELDAGARRYLSILESFNDVIQSKKQPKPNENQSMDSRNISDILFGKMNSSATSQEKASTNYPQPSANLGWEKGVENHMNNAEASVPHPGVDRFGTGLDYLPLGTPNLQPGECGAFDQPIDLDWSWFSGGQKNYIPTDEVPLYNLMDTF